MAYEQKDMEGALFRNKDKDTDQQPNMTGSIMIEGKMYLLSAWTNTMKDGTKWQKLKARVKQDRPAPSSGETVMPPMAATDDAFSDSVPF